jgi:two-component system, NtrC family, response regulator AtoC
MEGANIDTDRDKEGPACPPPCGYFLLLAGDDGVRTLSLPGEGQITIGRGDEADVRVTDRRVSRRHVRIHLGSTLAVEDLESANGTYLGGSVLSPGERHTLAVGSAIEIGTTTIVIRRPSTVPRARIEPPEAPRPSEAMEKVLALADRLAKSMISVLIVGETGVGKDVLAERIHSKSGRAHRPLLRVNCAALSPTLVESELFGHEKGAYTGATAAAAGLLQGGNGSTVFLDEVGELPLEIQAKLLLAVERREVTPVGATRPRPIDVRFLSATNRRLSDEVANGTFRRDLYFRLNGITIKVPPLRERQAEIEPLARKFVAEAARTIGRSVPEIPRESLEALRASPWPGNVRELRSTVERAMLLCDGDVLQFEAATEDSLLYSAPKGIGSERDRIIEALAKCGGNQSKAAKFLGMSRNTLIARLEKYQLARPLRPRRP